MTAQKISKTKLIPSYGSNERNVLLHAILTYPDYLKLINDGWRLFSAEELDLLEQKYPGGMTWEEIENELMSFGVVLKKPTFRKHIQDKLLPVAIGYRLVGSKRMAVFPKNTIAQINLNQYLLKATKAEDFIHNIPGLIEEHIGLTIRTAISSKYFDLLMGFGERFRIDLATDGFAAESWGNLNNYREVIRDVLKLRPDLEQKALQYLDEIESKWKLVSVKVDEFLDFIDETPLSLEELRSILNDEGDES